MRDQAQKWQEREDLAEPLIQRATDRVVPRRLRTQQDEGNRRQQVNERSPHLTIILHWTPEPDTRVILDV